MGLPIQTYKRGEAQARPEASFLQVYVWTSTEEGVTAVVQGTEFQNVISTPGI